MYQEFYSLREKPFVLTPDPQFLFLSESHRTAIESLLYGIQQKEGFMVITGDIGTGKTTICRAFLEKLDKNVKTAVIFNSFLTEEELLESILLDFGFSSKGRTKKERIDALNKLLIYFLSHGKSAVLIIDEAQNLTIPVLEQIRMLSNLETEKEKLLQIILFGQLELDQKLRSAELKQLNQRIAVRHHLMPLTPMETEAYIYQRLMVAGSQGTITFSKSGLHDIYKFSKGAPRLINLICDRALLGGFTEQTHYIDKDIIKMAKDSLLGEEKSSKPFYSFTLPKSLTSFRFPLLSIFGFLLAGVILLSQGYLSSLHNAKSFVSERIQYIFSRMPGPIPPSVAAFPLNKSEAKYSSKSQWVGNSEGASQEVSE
jgi:general secretion pathway protein A